MYKVMPVNVLRSMMHKANQNLYKILNKKVQYELDYYKNYEYNIWKLSLSDAIKYKHLYNVFSVKKRREEYDKLIHWKECKLKYSVNNTNSDMVRYNKLINDIKILLENNGDIIISADELNDLNYLYNYTPSN